MRGTIDFVRNFHLTSDSLAWRAERQSEYGRFCTTILSESHHHRGESVEENEMDLSSWLMVLISLGFFLIVVRLFLKKGPDLTTEEQEAQKAERERLEAGEAHGKKNTGDD